jgi:hypothetical protein
MGDVRAFAGHFHEENVIFAIFGEQRGFHCRSEALRKRRLNSESFVTVLKNIKKDKPRLTYSIVARKTGQVRLHWFTASGIGTIFAS